MNKNLRLLVIVLLISLYVLIGTACTKSGEIIGTADDVVQGSNAVEQTLAELQQVNDSLFPSDEPVCYDMLNAQGEKVGEYCE